MSALQVKWEPAALAIHGLPLVLAGALGQMMIQHVQAIKEVRSTRLVSDF